jgi:hypothetical protein
MSSCKSSQNPCPKHIVKARCDGGKYTVCNVYISDGISFNFLKVFVRDLVRVGLHDISYINK